MTYNDYHYYPGGWPYWSPQPWYGPPSWTYPPPQYVPCGHCGGTGKIFQDPYPFGGGWWCQTTTATNTAQINIYPVDEGEPEEHGDGQEEPE